MVGVVRHKESGREFVVKEYGKDFVCLFGELGDGDWRKKVGLLVMIEERFVVKLVDLLEDDESVSVIVELWGDGTLCDEIDGRKMVGKSFSEDVWICCFASSPLNLHSIFPLLPTLHLSSTPPIPTPSITTHHHPSPSIKPTHFLSSCTIFRKSFK